MSTLSATNVLRPERRDTEAHPTIRTLFRVAAAFSLLTVAGGAVNSATGSGFACPTWPGCYAGHFGPEVEFHDLVEFTHRAIAATTGVLVLCTAIASLRLPRIERPARILPWFAVLGIIGSAVFGMLTVLQGGIHRGLGMIDLFCALFTQVAMTLSTQSLERGAPRWNWTPASRLGAALVSGIVVLHELGTFLSGPSSFTVVLGWPMWRMVAIDRMPWLQVGRMILAAALLVGIARLCQIAWADARLRPVVIAVAVFTLIEQVMGQLIASNGVQMWLVSAFAASAAVLLFLVTLLTGHTALDRRR